LAFLAFGSTAIQSWCGAAINDFAGTVAINNLIQGCSVLSAKQSCSNFDPDLPQRQQRVAATQLANQLTAFPKPGESLVCGSQFVNLHGGEGAGVPGASSTLGSPSHLWEAHHLIRLIV
jgi:hypothetical protein